MKTKTMLVFTAVLFSAALLMSGCATTKGVAQGVTEDSQAAAKGVAAGGYGMWQGVLSADKWIKDNLW